MRADLGHLLCFASPIRGQLKSLSVPHLTCSQVRGSSRAIPPLSPREPTTFNYPRLQPHPPKTINSLEPGKRSSLWAQASWGEDFHIMAGTALHNSLFLYSTAGRLSGIFRGWSLSLDAGPCHFGHYDALPPSNLITRSP